MADDIASDTADNRADNRADRVDNTAAKSAVDLTDDQLEAQLCCLAAEIALRESEFLGLLAELDRRELWGLWGLRSAAHWLAWRLGHEPWRGQGAGAGGARARAAARDQHGVRRGPADLLQGAGAHPGRDAG